jgi:hypothetical protein
MAYSSDDTERVERRLRRAAPPGAVDQPGWHRRDGPGFGCHDQLAGPVQPALGVDWLRGLGKDPVTGVP